MGPCSAHVVLPGARTEKACPVGSVLHRVRKRNQLLVIVEQTGPTGLHHLRTQSGIAGAEQQQLIALTTTGAGVVVPGVLGVPDDVRALRRDLEDVEQLLVSAGEAGAFTSLHVAAGHTGVLVNALYVGAPQALGRVEPCCLRPAREPGVVDLVQLGGQLVAPLHQPRQPARGAALAALHHGQVDTIALTGQVALAAQAHIPRVQGELADHAPQLTHPQLHPQGHQRLLAFAQRPGHQHEQGIQHPGDLVSGGSGHVARIGVLQGAVVDDATLHQAQQIDKELVALQVLP